MDDLIMDERPKVENPVMLVGLTGWMDAGHVSTGTIGYMRERLGARCFAQIDPMDFYIFNFPVTTLPISIYLDDGRPVVTPINPMEFAALFRPHCRIEEGLVEEVSYPANEFWVAEEHNLIMFTGEEPHLRWGAYCDCIFGLCEELGVRDVYFVGSVASPVPHTREPRISVSVSDPLVKQRFDGAGFRFSKYEGPSSIITSLTYHAPEVGLSWSNLVVEVPHYPFLEMPTYPQSILKATSALQQLVGVELDLSDLERAAQAARRKLDELMDTNEDFATLVAKLEEAYDYTVTEEDEELLRRLIDGLDLEGESGDQ